MKNYYEQSRELAHLYSAYALIHWDFETQMPKGAAAWRAETMGHFAGLLHEKGVHPDYLAAAQAALAAAKDELEKEALKNAIKDIQKKTLLPQKLVEEMSQASALAHEGWVTAKNEKNFSLFAPHLEKMIRLSREQASYYAQGKDPYDALLDEYSPGMTSAMIKKLFDELRPQLQELIGKRKKPLNRAWSVPIEIQEKICHDVVAWMGFPAEQLVQARSVHPFCTNLHPTDVRITTRYREDDPLMSIMSTVHELGHGLYENQLPSEHVGTPLNQANGMDMHESQSRLWEVCLATSPEFFRWVHQWYSKNAPEHIKDWSAQDLFLLASVVKPSLIRTESDPVTYGMHVMIRFELEMAIFNGTLSVAQLPSAWNEAYQKYLGITPPDDSVGILQDSHWSSGAFGYFPSYLLGTMISCQLHATLQERFPDLSARVEKGNLSEVRDWLKTNVHRFGRGMSAPLIIKQATGKDLSSAPFLKFLQERFIA